MKRVVCLLLLITSFAGVEPFFSVVETLWTIYEISSEFTGGGPSNEDLMDSIVDLKNDINQVTKDVTNRIEQLYEELMTQLPRLGQINRGMETFSRLFNRITYLYGVFERLLRPSRKTTSGRALKDFSTGALGSLSDSVDATLHAIHELFIPTEIGHLNDGLLGLLARNLPQEESGPVKCNAGPPPEEQFFLLYMALVTAEVRGFTMLTFTYTLLQNATGEDYSDDIKSGRMTTLTRVQEYMWQIRDISNWTSSVYFACDPPGGYERDVSFAEFEMFQSLYIVNQYSVVPDCSLYCEDLDYTVPPSQNLQCPPEDKLCQEIEQCTGRIHQCTDISGGQFEICKNDNEKIGSKRYLYYAHGGNNLGFEDGCKKSNKYYQDYFHKYSEKTDLQHKCFYCICTCLEEEPSSKFFVFNLRPQLADIDKNKIVSGIKFTMTPHVVHIQIQQGMVRHDKFDANTLEWKPVDVMQLDETKSPANSSKLSLYDKNGKEYVEDVDFARLMADRKDFYLDDLIAPDGYVITGARLNRPSSDDKAVQLEIRATPYNFTSEKVIIRDDRPSIWITPTDMEGVIPEYTNSERTFVRLHDESRRKAQFDGSTRVVSSPNRRIGVMSSNEKGDMRGTVFPLLDIREVTPPTPFLLQGIGLMYKEPVDGKAHGYLFFTLRSVSRKRFLEVELTMD